MTDIQISILDKTYRSAHAADRQHRAIADLQLRVARDQFVCLLGPSGCGKTTLLNMIAGLDSQYQGQIRVGRLESLPKIGYVFQNPRLLPWYDVRRNIELVFPGKPPAELIDALLNAMQLGDVQHEFPERLSLGMQRRVAIIRAFAIDPDLLLMDEPFVSLDAPSARQVRNLLYTLWQQRPHTVLFVSHDLREAIALADRLIFLSPSPMRIVADITVDIPRPLRNDEAQIETFRGTLYSRHPRIADLL